MEHVPLVVEERDDVAELVVALDDVIAGAQRGDSVVHVEVAVVRLEAEEVQRAPQTVRQRRLLKVAGREPRIPVEPVAREGRQQVDDIDLPRRARPGHRFEQRPDVGRSSAAAPVLRQRRNLGCFIH